MERPPRADVALHLRHRRHDHRLDALPRAIVGRVPHAPRRADGRRGFLPAHRRTHRRRGDARAVRLAVRCRRARVACARRRRSIASSSGRSSARSRGFTAFAREAQRGRRAPRLRDGRRSRQHRVRARRTRDDGLLRRRGRRARRRARQARARPLPARRRSASGALPAECLVFEDAPLGIEAARRAGHARRGHRVDGSRRRVGRGAARHRAGAGLHDAGRAGARGASSRLITASDRSPGHGQPQRRAGAGRRREPDHRRAPREARGAARAGPRLSRTISAAMRSRRDLHARYDAKTNEELEALGDRGRGRRPDDAEARDGQGELRDAAGHDRAASSSTSPPTRVGAEAHDAFKHWDLGDIVGATGHAVQDRAPASSRSR